MWAVARRPQWIAAFFLALVIAAGFAALGQWQINRSVIEATVIDRDTEAAAPLSNFATPQTAVTGVEDGQRVTFEGTIVPGDSSILTGRLNGGTTGYWVMAHVVTDTGASIAVALGWAPTLEEAEAAAEAADSPQIQMLVPFEGRYLASEGPQDSDFENGERKMASVAALINEWDTAPDGVYNGYLVTATPAAGLDAIDSPRPDGEVSVNWLNIFYAVEWVVFAGFAIYLWWRLVKDAWEREQEDYEEDEYYDDDAAPNVASALSSGRARRDSDPAESAHHADVN